MSHGNKPIPQNPAVAEFWQRTWCEHFYKRWRIFYHTGKKGRPRVEYFPRVHSAPIVIPNGIQP